MGCRLKAYGHVQGGLKLQNLSVRSLWMTPVLICKINNWDWDDFSWHGRFCHKYLSKIEKKSCFRTPTPKMQAIQNANGATLRNYIKENMSRMYFMVKRAKRKLLV